MLKIIKTVFNTFVDWANIYNKPSTFTPSAHTQDISTINGLLSTLDTKVDTAEYNSKINQDLKITAKPTFTGLDVKGTTATDAIYSDMGINFIPVPDPSAPTLSLIADASGLLNVGVYNYRVTFITTLGETHTSANTSITTDVNNKKVLVTIPTSDDSRVTGRKIYRTPVGAATTTENLVTTINDNTTTTYIDNIPDGSLGARCPYWGVNSTCKQIMVKGARCMLLDSNATIVGDLAGVNLTTGGQPTLFGNTAGWKLTTGSYNTLIGAMSGAALTTGSSNTAVGRSSLFKITTTGDNVAVGMNALELSTGASKMTCVGRSSGATSVNGTSCVFLGYQSGYYETGSNKLFIDNQSRTNEADARVKALIYGGFDANTTNQFLNINGTLQALSYKSSDGSTGATGSFTSADGKTIIVKNGLITSIV